MNENDFDEGLRQVLVCSYGADCANATSKKYGNPTAIYDAIKSARNVAGLNRKLYVVRTSCQGWCQYAPVCSVLPKGRVYQDIKPEEAGAFVEAVMEGKEQSFAERRIWDFSQTRAQNLNRQGGGGQA
jgi:(2Fe-2S) ferredoxin